jgi:putative hemolysin
MTGIDLERALLKLDLQFKGPWPQRLFPIVKTPLEKVLRFDRINHVYQQIEASLDCGQFLTAAQKILNIQYRLEEKDLERIPSKGSTVVVMNHPFGGIEGLLLASLLRSRRRDIKIMANYLLAGIPELKDLFIFVDPFQAKDSIRKNIKALREAIDWLKDGGLLGVFPAGEVAHYHFNQRKVIDPPWSETIARLVKKTCASVLPVFIKGSNGPLFQIAGFVHPKLRTALLPRELLNKQKKEFDIRIGRLIPPKSLAALQTDKEVTNYLRQRTYILEHRSTSEKNSHQAFRPKEKMKTYPPVVFSTQAHLMIEEIRNLPSEQILVRHGEYIVAYAQALQIPYLLREIGRLREVTFRKAGEGTGKALDLDEFDTLYLHLFTWKTDTEELIGAYRLGPTDNLLSRFSQRSLYTQTLFSCHHSFFKQINPALELGRSFIRAEYQKSFSPLLLLWKGIGQYVARNPRYKILFGPVSINKDYQDYSRELMVTYLKAKNYLPDLAKLIRPKKPFRFKPEEWIITASRHLLNDIEEVSSWVSELEPDQKGIPILLKQYLKLGGKLLGFNIDPQFSHVLDGLILVDLTQTDPNILSRYMGKEDGDRFLAYHGRHREMVQTLIHQPDLPNQNRFTPSYISAFQQGSL